MGFHFLFTFLNQRTGDKEFEEFFSMKQFEEAWKDALDKAIESEKQRFLQDHYWCLISVADNNRR